MGLLLVRGHVPAARGSGDSTDPNRAVGAPSETKNLAEWLRATRGPDGSSRPPDGAQRPRTSASASSTAWSSAASRRPTDGPSLSGSTTVVCSTSTRVELSPSVIGGRKLAGRALVEVGATSVVLRSRNSSACTTTAYRAPRCSRPRAPRLPGSLKTSPRTTQSVTRGASSASCSRTRRISSRSVLSEASCRTSARIADRARLRAAASCNAVLTASESVIPAARTTSSAAADEASSRTCSDLATSEGL